MARVKTVYWISHQNHSFHPKTSLWNLLGSKQKVHDSISKLPHTVAHDPVGSSGSGVGVVFHSVRYESKTKRAVRMSDDQV
jgi:hypothetical protein